MEDLENKHENVFVNEVFNIRHPQYINTYTFEPYKDAHPTTLGHKAIAKSMYEYLQNTDVIPCH